LKCDLRGDGIDLWTKVAGRSGVMWSAEATIVKRHAAPADDAQPPGDLLSLDSWFENVPPADVALPDFEPVTERADDHAGRPKVRSAAW